MNALALVFGREIRERRNMLVAAACASLFPPATALFLASGSNARDTREWTAWFLTAAFALITSIVLGAITLDADSPSGRLAFFLARPIPSPALFFGKMLAVVALAIGTGALVAAPTWLLDGLPSEPELWLLTFLVTPLVALVVQALSVAWRSRSPWLLVDALVAAILFVACGLSVSMLQKAELLPLAGRFFVIPSRTASVLLVAVPVYLICAFAIAGSRQLEAGRMDALASHHTLVRWLLGLLGIPVALLGVWAIAIALVGPSSLHRLAISAREGSWIGLHGAAAGRGKAGFLCDTASGRSLRLPPFTSPTIAPNGSSAVWPVSRSAGRYELSAWDLTGAPRELPLPGVVFPTWPALAISPNGTRLAAMDGSSLVVLELASARVLGSTSFARGVPAKSLRFLTEDRVLFLEGSVSSGTTKAYEYDVAARSLTSLFEVPATNWSKGPDFSRDGTLCLTSDEPGKLVLRSGRTGAVTATLVDDPHARVWGALLPDGRIAAIVKKTDATRTVSLHVFSRDGVPERTLPLDGVFASFVGTTGAGRLVLSIIHRKGPVPEGTPTLSYSLVSVDVDATGATGGVKTLAQNVRVLRGNETLDLEPTPLVGIEGFEASDRLVRVDEGTGALTPVLTR